MSFLNPNPSDNLDPHRKEKMEMYQKIQNIDGMVNSMITTGELSGVYRSGGNAHLPSGSNINENVATYTTVYPSYLFRSLKEEIERHITEKIPFYGFSIINEDVGGEYYGSFEKILVCSCGEDWSIAGFYEMILYGQSFTEFIEKLNWAWRIKVREAIGVNAKVFKEDLEEVIKKSKKDHKNIFEGIKL